MGKTVTASRRHGNEPPNSKLDPTRAPSRGLDSGTWRSQPSADQCCLIEGVGDGALAAQLQAVRLRAKALVDGVVHPGNTSVH